MATDIYCIPIGGDALVELTGLYDELSESYVNNATATGKLLEHDATEVASFNLAYKADSDGVYQGTIPGSTTTDLTEYERYTIRITATTAGGLTYKEDICAIAQRSEE